MTKNCFCFDLDGTITRSEILPLIASEVGLQEEMELLTKLTMAGQIPFEESFRLRFAILRSIPIENIQAITNAIELDPYITDFIRNNKEHCYVITGNLDKWIQPIIEKLGCNFFSSKSNIKPDGSLNLTHIIRKNAPGLLLKEHYDRLIAIGDGYNDIPLFEVANIGIAYNGVHSSPESLISNANYVTLNGEGLCRLLNTLL